MCALLGMLSTAVAAMDAAATAAHHEAAFAFLLRALDLRRRRPATLAPAGQLDTALDKVEGATVATFVALTLKLSESQFKPLFLRLLDWAANAPEDAGGSRAARGVALAAVVNALTERLRSVFVPYFRYLLDPFLAHLAGEWRLRMAPVVYALYGAARVGSWFGHPCLLCGSVCSWSSQVCIEVRVPSLHGAAWLMHADPIEHRHHYGVSEETLLSTLHSQL